ncbi:MAG: type II toxin-antitoxin system RelE/ParE family toxin [Pacificimonas sp.]|jgi:plasmid stabilization system protein ParE|nr:type II toxin-antitoxin system RelE/ParE family toxin [Pacificimonas sp.]
MTPITWSNVALDDLERVVRFLLSADAELAGRIRAELLNAPERLQDFPRLGPLVEGHEEDGVRRLVFGRYEIRYEVTEERVIILRVFHQREDR